MGNCVHCGKAAGWFRSTHAECQADYERVMAAKVAEEDRMRGAYGSAVTTLAGLIRANGDMTTLLDAVEADIGAGLLARDEKTVFVAKAWALAVDDFLEDGLLSEEEDARLHQVMTTFSLTPADLNPSGALLKAGKASVLRSVMEGKPILAKSTSVPVNLQRGESVVWVFDNVDYLEDRVKRERVGGSQGVSLRVMSGVYYRVGAFKARTVESTHRTKVDQGALVVTTKHLYFVGGATSKKIPYSKIVSFEQYSNGIGLMRDAASALPQTFVLGDGWFACNLIMNLAKDAH